MDGAIQYNVSTIADRGATLTFIKMKDRKIVKIGGRSYIFPRGWAPACLAADQAHEQGGLRSGGRVLMQG